MFEQRLNELKAFVLNSHPQFKDSPLSVDALLDSIVAIYDDCKNYGGAEKGGPIPKFLQKFGSVISTLRSIRLNKEDYIYIRLLAKGQFGEVSLVRGKFDQKVYAMKALRKSEMLKQADIAFFMEEKQILAALDSKWITQLSAAFQDESTLYLVMDYLPGGDLSNLIMRADEGSLVADEKFVKFYIAETLMALGDLHNLDYVHRDLKPGNILLDAEGHVKLADFGSCIKLDANSGVTSLVTVGTPDYISPEVLQANEGTGAYGKECDFWSLGVTMYEMLVGDPPFYAESLAETYAQIMNHKNSLIIPDDVAMSAQCKDLIKKLICDKADRLKTVDDIKKHPFFADLKWDKIHEQTAPFVPDIKNDVDVSNFAELDEEEESPALKLKLGSRDKNFVGSNLAFIGYTYNRTNSIANVVASAETKASVKTNMHVAAPEGMWEQKIAQAEAECENLRKKLTQETKKAVSLESTQTTLESELVRIRKVLTSEMEKVAQKEEQMNQLERGKKLAHIELENLQKKYTSTLDERAEFEIKLNQLNETLEKELKSGSAAKEEQHSLRAEKARLETALASANQKLETQTQSMKQSYDEIAVLSRRSAVLQVEVETLRSELANQQQEKDEVVVQLEELELQMNNEKLKRTAVEEALAEAEQAITEVRSNLADTESKLKEQIRDREMLQLKLSEIESAKYSADREVLTLKLKIDDMASSNSVNTLASVTEGEAKPGPPVIGAGKTIGRRNSVLQSFMKKDDSAKQLELEQGLRKQANQESAKLTAEKLSLENQLKESQSKLNSAKAEIVEAKKVIKNLEDKQAEKKGKGTLARGGVSAFGSDYDLSKLDNDSRAKLEKKIAEMKKTSAVTAIEISEIRKKYELEVEQRESLQKNVSQLQEQSQTFSQAKYTLETRVKELDGQVENLNRELTISRLEIEKSRATNEDQSVTIRTQAKTLALLETERDELLIRVQNISKQKAEVESEATSLKSRLNDLLSSHIDPDEFSALAEECSNFHRELTEMTLKYDELSLKYRRATNNAPGGDSTNRRNSVTEVVEDVESTENSKRARMNVSKMKGLEQQLSVEMSRRAAVETELTAVKQSKSILENELDDLRKQISIQQQGSHSGPTHNVISSTMNSIRSNITEYKLRKLRPILFPTGVHPIVQGWLRIRIAKNVKRTKFEWVKKYALVRDNQLFLFDKEKEKDNSDARSVLNFRVNYFTVRPVDASELIHLSPKEVASVFSINILKDGFTSIVSLDNIAGEHEQPDQVVWEKRLHAVTKSIDKEVHFKDATEKMIAAASGDTKKKLSGELEESLRRLKVLRSEKTDIEKGIKNLESDTATIYSAVTYSNEELQVNEITREIEKKEAYKRGVENMLSVTKNNDTRKSLNNQLEVVSHDIGTLRTSLTSLDKLDSLGSSMNMRSSSNGSTGSPKKLVRKTRLFDTQEKAPAQSNEFSGTTYLMALDETDRERWIYGIDCVATSVREIAHSESPGGGDIDSILAQ